DHRRERAPVLDRRAEARDRRIERRAGADRADRRERRLLPDDPGELPRRPPLSTPRTRRWRNGSPCRHRGAEGEVAMVLDTVGCAGRYVSLHPGFAKAFAYLVDTDLESLPAGRTTIDGDDLFVIIDRKDGRGRDGARLEAHQRYIDIQCTIRGEEEI